jgi:hypothetical protein
LGGNQKLPANFDVSSFLTRIDQHQDLHGARVVLYDGYTMHVVREGPPWCAANLVTVVIKPDLGQSTIKSAKAA